MYERSYVEEGLSVVLVYCACRVSWRSSTRNHPNKLNEDILHEKLAEVGIEVVHLERVEPTLEDVFLSLATSRMPKGHNVGG